jgi:hypothetical protein
MCETITGFDSEKVVKTHGVKSVDKPQEYKREPSWLCLLGHCVEELTVPVSTATIQSGMILTL